MILEEKVLSILSLSGGEVYDGIGFVDVPADLSKLIWHFDPTIIGGGSDGAEEANEVEWLAGGLPFF